MVKTAMMQAIQNDIRFFESNKHDFAKSIASNHDSGVRTPISAL